MKGIWIPMELIELDISWTKRILIAEISQLEMLDKGCIASNSHFSNKLKLSTQAISKALHELEKEQLICINNAQTKRNIGRKITINFSKSAINFSKSAIHQSGESKESNTINTIVDYLNIKSSKSFKSNSSKTKSLINSRLKDGFSLNDFKKVIDTKCAQWAGTDFERFIRPETLFGAKFESYLNECSDTTNEVHYSW